MVKVSQIDIQNWLINQISTELDIKIEEIDPQAPIASLGVDSITMVQFAVQLEKWLNIDIDPASLYQYPSIHSLSAFIHSKL